MPDDQASELPGTVSIQTLATLFGIDVRNAHVHARAGIFVKTARGKYLLVPSVQAYTEHLREQAAGRQTRKGSDIDVVEEGALLKRANRKMVELKQQQLEGSLVSIPELKEVWGDIIKGIRSMVLSWPEQVAFELPHLTDHDKSVMRRIANGLLKTTAARNETLGPLPDPPKDD